MTLDESSITQSEAELLACGFVPAALRLEVLDDE